MLYDYFPPDTPSTKSLAALDPDSVDLSIDSHTELVERLPQFRNLKRLWFANASEAHVAQISSLQSLDTLVLKAFRGDSLDAISRLENLRVLVLMSASRLRSLDVFLRLQQLEELHLEYAPKCEDLSPISELTKLSRLGLSGTISGQIYTIETLQPVATLPRLRELYLWSIRVRSGGLRPLASLRSLKKLELPLTFDASDYYYLAGRMPGTRCSAFGGYVELNGLECSTCGSTLIRPVGKNKRTLCRKCKPAAFSKMLARHLEQRGRET